MVNNDFVRIALRNVGKRRKRTILTIIGIFVGIAAVVALVSLGQGLQNTINEQFEKVGADKIIIQPKQVALGALDVERPLTDDEVDLIDKVSGVSRTAGALFTGVNVVYNDIQRTVFAFGIPDKNDAVDLIDQVNTWEILEGRLLGHRDKGKVVIGNNLATRNVFQKNVRLGDKIEVSGETFEIVGIFKRMGDPAIDGGIAMPEEDLRRLSGNPESYSYIVSQTARGIDPDTVAERVEKDLRRDRDLDEGKEDFTVQTSTELIASFNAVLNVIQVVFVGIAAISLLVGGIGIMNTMYTAVLERTREIGVMKAIGARNRDIMTIFMTESGFLGLAGGVVGVIFGVIISKSVEIGANYFFGEGTIYASFPILLIVGALLFAFVVGSVSGLLPAIRASRLKPVDALRYE